MSSPARPLQLEHDVDRFAFLKMIWVLALWKKLQALLHESEVFVHGQVPRLRQRFFKNGEIEFFIHKLLEIIFYFFEGIFCPIFQTEISKSL